jgi:hypothetical protein
MSRIIYNDSRDPYVAGDLTIFRDIDEAQREVEVYDADPPDVFVCDEDGRQCRMLVDTLHIMDDTLFPRFDMAKIDQMLDGFIRSVCGEAPGATLNDKLTQILRYQQT